MDKGKKPIQEEEDYLSLLDDIHQPNTILSPPDFCALPQGISVLDGAGPAKEAPLVDEMEGADQDDFFSRFLSMNFAESSVMEQCSKAEESSLPVLPAAQPQKDHVQLPPEVALPPLPRAPAQRRGVKAKPFEFRKTMPRDELEKLALHDPKRAKRIITNRMSAVRAKEKKKLYIFMLEHKLSTLQSKSTKMSAQLTLLQTESNSLNAENSILKDRMDIAAQQVHLQDALNDQIRSEIQHMRTLFGQKFVLPNRRVFHSSSGNINYAMNAPLAAQQFLSHLQVQKHYQQQQLQFNFQQPDLGQLNFRVQYEQGESSQLQQLQQQHPPRYDHFPVQNEQAQAHQFHHHQQQPSYFEQLLSGDYNIENSAPTLSEIYK